MKDFKNRTPKHGVEALKEIIEAAKAEKKRLRKVAVKRVLTQSMIALIAVTVLLPNISWEMGYALGKLPLIGGIFKAVTFREYNYMDDRFSADVKIPEIVLEDGTGTSQEELKSTNREIREIADRLVEEFKISMEKQEGYGGLQINYEVVNTTDDYFTLKLMTYEDAASGHEENYSFTVDRLTGKRLSLKDLFPGNKDYLQDIMDDLKSQMREINKAEGAEIYFVDSGELRDEDIFCSFKEDQQFYLDSKGRLHITFNEGQVAASYIGAVDFTISEKVFNKSVMEENER